MRGYPYFYATLAVIILLVGYPPQTPATQAEKNAAMNSMSKSVTIPTPKGDLYFTLETLEAIKQKLLEALKKQEARKDYVHLIKEIETGNAASMIFENRASIGGWRLIYRDNKLLLECQEVGPDIRLVYTARLEWQDEQWQVKSINIQVVRRLGI